jgi:hypothetical protein
MPTKLHEDKRSRNILEFTNAKQKVQVIKVAKGKQAVVNAEVPVKQLRKMPHNDNGVVWSPEASLDIIAKDHYFFRLQKPIVKEQKGIQISSSWQHLMSKEEVKAYWDKNVFNGWGFGHTDLHIKNLRDQHVSFEKLWKVIVNNKLKHWEWFFAEALLEWQDQFNCLMSYVNCNQCATPCKTCSKPCQVHIKSYRPRADDFFSPWRPDDDEYTIYNINYHSGLLERTMETIDLYAGALESLGVDLNTINIKQVLGVKEKSPKKVSRVKKSKEKKKK